MTETPTDTSLTKVKQRVHLTIPVVLAEVLAGKSNAEIAEKLGVKPDSVGWFLRKNRISRQNLEVFKQLRADILTHKQYRILDHMTEKKLKDTSIRDLSVSMSALSNMERLERGQSTSNVSIQKIDGDLAEIDKEIARLEKKIEKTNDKNITDIEIVEEVKENNTDTPQLPGSQPNAEIDWNE